MKISARSKHWLWLLIPVLIALGFFRFFLFENINEHLDHLWNKTPQTKMSPHLSFLMDWEFWPLYYLKFALTGVMTLLFLMLNGLGLFIVHGRPPLRYLLGIYGLLFGIAVIFFGGGYLIGFEHKGYYFARIMMGVAQSPLPFLILLLGFRLTLARSE